MASLDKQDTYNMDELELKSGTLTLDDIRRGVEVGMTPDFRFPARVKKIWPDTDVNIFYAVTLGEKAETVPIHVVVGQRPQKLEEVPAKSIIIVGRGKAEVIRARLRVVYNTIIFHHLLIDGKVTYQYIVCDQDMPPDEPTPSIGQSEPQPFKKTNPTTIR